VNIIRLGDRQGRRVGIVFYPQQDNETTHREEKTVDANSGEEFETYEAPAWVGKFRCGKCKGRHHAVAQVRACCAGTACTWMIQDGVNEDGEAVIVDCGYPTTYDARGWRCEAGHEHVRDEVRHGEGWDYASDEGEAELLAKYGTEPRDMATGGAFLWGV